MRWNRMADEQQRSRKIRSSNSFCQILAFFFLFSFNPHLVFCCFTMAVFVSFCREITLEVSSACFVKIPIAQGHAISIPIVSLIPAEKE